MYGIQHVIHLTAGIALRNGVKGWPEGCTVHRPPVDCGGPRWTVDAGWTVDRVDWWTFDPDARGESTGGLRWTLISVLHHGVPTHCPLLGPSRSIRNVEHTARPNAVRHPLANAPRVPTHPGSSIGPSQTSRTISSPAALPTSSVCKKSKESLVVENTTLSAARHARHVVNSGLCSGGVGSAVCMSA